MDQNSPVGVFDSGVGGISVLRVMRKMLPSENFIFYGDSQHAPYGEKTGAEVIKLSEAAVKELLRRDVKAIVIACNTATSEAAEALRAEYPDRIIIGMEPAVKPAAEEGIHHPRVLVLATERTIAGGRLHRLIRTYEDQAEIIPLAAPGIVRLVEEGLEDSEEMLSYLRSILRPYSMINGVVEQHLDSIVLGCTHFPFASARIREAIGYPFVFYDGAEGTARETRHRLSQRGLLREEGGAGDVLLLNSDPSPERMALMKRLLNELPLESETQNEKH